MRVLSYLKRTGKYILKGIPEKKVFVNVEQIQYGQVLRNKNVLVTGGGSGIGFAIASKFAHEGANVLIVGRNEDKLKAACEKIGCGVDYYVMDITNFSELEANTEKIAGVLQNKLDILVNNAGVYVPKKMEQIQENDWDYLFDTNLKASYFLTKHLVKYLIQSKGSIVMIASDTAYIGSTNPYHITKAGVCSFVRGLAKELIDDEVRVNAIAPGPTLSEINKTDPANGLQRNDRYRVLRAEEIAEVAMFLSLSAATCINGQVICCDEGDALR